MDGGHTLSKVKSRPARLTFRDCDTRLCTFWYSEVFRFGSIVRHGIWLIGLLLTLSDRRREKEKEKEKKGGGVRKVGGGGFIDLLLALSDRRKEGAEGVVIDFLLALSDRRKERGGRGGGVLLFY